MLRVCSSVCVWDLGTPKMAKSTEEKNLSGIPTTFKHLDLTWKPQLKVRFERYCKESTCVVYIYCVCADVARHHFRAFCVIINIILEILGVVALLN